MIVDMICLLVSLDFLSRPQSALPACLFPYHGSEAYSRDMATKSSRRSSHPVHRMFLKAMQ
jgi:hypothetical protein